MRSDTTPPPSPTRNAHRSARCSCRYLYRLEAVRRLLLTSPGTTWYTGQSAGMRSLNCAHTSRSVITMGSAPCGISVPTSSSLPCRYTSVVDECPSSLSVCVMVWDFWVEARNRLNSAKVENTIHSGKGFLPNERGNAQRAVGYDSFLLPSEGVRVGIPRPLPNLRKRHSVGKEELG